MKSYFYKLLIVFILSLLFFNNQAFSAGGLTKEDCNTGIYNAFYDNTCDTCGYFNSGVNRLYEGAPMTFWDYYLNTENKEMIFSSNSSASVIDFGNYLNEETITGLGVLSNWVPALIPNNEAIIFLLRDLVLTSVPNNRNTPVGRIEYLLRGAPVDNNGDISLSLSDWAYLPGYETQQADLTWYLDFNSYVSDGGGTKMISSSSVFEHKECYVLLPSWCGDNTLDSAKGETCDDGNNIDGDGCSATCNIEIPLISSSSSSSSSSSGGGTTFCGDGNVQRPNSNLEMEECDFGFESDWSFCNRDCTYSSLTIPSSGIGEITIPNGGSLIFGPVDNVIIGEGMNPYLAHSLGRPYLRNASDYDFYFDQLCVVDNLGTTLLGSSVCEDTGRIIKSGETIYFPYTPNFVGGAVTIGNYADNRLVTTIKHNGIRYDEAYFVGALDVRVAKSSIATTGGGTSYLANNSSIGNISDMANNGTLDPSKNKNFVGVGVSGGDSSYSNDITNAGLVATIQGEGDSYSNDLNKVSDISGTALGNTSSLSEFENYNGISNVFILREQNFIIDSNILAGLSGARTYVIENGDLIINSNINYSDNIAFVVKGGNIGIDKNVGNINGTYITITRDLVGGNFLGILGKTTDILVVNGSLYGNINDLISERTYVKQNSFNQIDVGTIVSFGSSLFRKTAPLLSTFINEYLRSEKIAK